jgi:8-oxo-dGTP pyrophosphatase MutT (NUDIX family)
MHRNDLTQKLQNYHVENYEELIHKENLLSFIMCNEECFERSLEQGHITASAWILNPDKTKALLMHHKKLNIWCQLGGHSDGDSDILATAIKEAKEESGLKNIVPLSENIFDIDIHEIPARGKEPSHLHYDIRFLLHSPEEEELVANEESNELKWVSKDLTELPSREPSILRMREKWIAKHPL